MTGKKIKRPSKKLIKAFYNISSATAASELSLLGIRDPFIQGPVCRTPGAKVVGPAITLQFMPKREYLYDESEYTDPEKRLSRHVLYSAAPGDVVVVVARGDMRSGCFGEMMLTYFKGKGGIGVVIDGCMRDYPAAKKLGLGLWLRGVSPNHASQIDIFPFAFNVPIACGDALVLPGDIIIADEDGAVVIPITLAQTLYTKALDHAKWEEFSRLKLQEGKDLRKYYPPNEEAWKEYVRWCKEQGRPHPGKRPVLNPPPRTVLKQ